MRDHVAVRRAAQCATGLQERGMEPPSVLVRAFHIDVGDAVFGAVFAVAQNKGMGGVGIEPHIQNVKHLIIIIGVHVIAQETLLGSLRIPTIGTFDLKRLGDPGVNSVIAQQEIGVSGQQAFAGKA